MSETTVGREPVQIVEIQQPLCANTYGVSPCTASGTPSQKCYNTRATCQDTANFTLGDPLKLYFSRGHVAEQGVDGASYIIPCLQSVSTVPTRINLASSNPDAQGLGTRANCRITFKDFAHNDRIVDPYLIDRTWNPLSPDRGSFWTRWLYRNRYRQNIVIKVYEGYSGQSLSQMTSRTYFLQSVSSVGPDGTFDIVGKDILSRVEERKAQAPTASPGTLYASINDSDLSFEVEGASLSDYPSVNGYVRIGDEIILYSTRATSANGIQFTVPAPGRGTLGSTAASHDAGATVQRCIRYVTSRPDNIVNDLLTDWAGVDASYIDTDAWQDEVDTYMTIPRGTVLVSKPTSVFKLISELQEQLLFNIWWDERASTIRFKAIRDITETPDLLTEESHILADSLYITEKPRERLSQLWFYYDLREPTLSLTDEASYQTVYVAADLASESDEEYGEPAVRKIFGRWVTSSTVAENTADDIIARYSDTPAEVKFRVDAKDRSKWVGDHVRISHHLDVDQYGDRRIRYWTIVSAEEVVPGEVVEYVAEDTTAWVA